VEWLLGRNRKGEAVMRGVAVLAALLLGCEVAAGGGEASDEERNGGWGPGSAYGRMFDPATIETVRGEVTAVELINPRKGMACGVCLTLQTEAGGLTIHLGPERHINRQETGIELHDRLEVTGSRVLFKGEPILIAVRLQKGDATLVLRDGQGVPLWSGWHRRAR
jgi:hypothetical protein